MSESMNQSGKAIFHLPGLFEFYELYKTFLPIYRRHRDYFYDWCEIGSIYGSPADCLWGGGRVGYGEDDPREVLALMREYGISARLTFSNSQLREEHLTDRKCNHLCRLLEESAGSEKLLDPEPTKEMSTLSVHSIEMSTLAPSSPIQNGVIVHSDLLVDYLQKNYPSLYLVSSTTKVLTGFDDLKKELERSDFQYVVPDFRLNKHFAALSALPQDLKDKVEFLCNECCWIGCKDRKACYENVSRMNLGEDVPEHLCRAPEGEQGYRFSKAMENPAFIGVRDILKTYLPMGFTNFKLEGRSLGSAMVLEFLLYYLTKPKYQIRVREHIYLDSMLDLF